jgi:excisionase family DNA binding protein
MELARVARRCIVEALDRSRAVTIKLSCENGDVSPVELPPTALKLIGQVLGLMSEGKPVTFMPAKQELTTVEAANFLNVSRPFVIKEIKEGRIPHRMVGAHRRIPIDGLIAYANAMTVSREAALDELSQLSSEMDLDY